jgi:hypothetical protein
MAQRGLEARIDLGELEKLCTMQATDEEIAAFFGVSTRTIERRRKSPKFAEVMERGKAKGRLSLRRMQIKLLEAGNATMGVWLGKQYLGQTDQVQFGSYDSPPVAFCLAMPRGLPQHLAGSILEAQCRQIDAPQAIDVGTEASSQAIVEIEVVGE